MFRLWITLQKKSPEAEKQIQGQLSQLRKSCQGVGEPTDTSASNKSATPEAERGPQSKPETVVRDSGPWPRPDKILFQHCCIWATCPSSSWKDTHNPMLSCDRPSFTLINFSQMHRIQSRRRKAKYLMRKKGFMSSVKGVSHLSRRAKRRLCCKLQLWMWRKRREKCRFWVLRAKKRACGISSSPCLSVKTQKNKSKVPTHHIPNVESSVSTPALVSPPGCDTEDTLRGQDCLLNLCESVSLSETFSASSSLQNLVTDTNVSADNVSQTAPTATEPSEKTETLAQLSEITDTFSHTVTPLLSTSDACGSTAHLKEQRTTVPAQRLEVDGPSGQFPAVTPGQNRAKNRDTDERISSKKTTSSQMDGRLLTKDIHGIYFPPLFMLCIAVLPNYLRWQCFHVSLEFLDDFYRIYGSFIPLQKTDVLRHLERKFNTDLSDR